MARKHYYDSQPDYGVFIDHDLEKVNAKIRAGVAKSTIRKPGESAHDHYNRFYADFKKKEKHRDAFGNI
jgi:hypothetical protein